MTGNDPLAEIKEALASSIQRDVLNKIPMSVINKILQAHQGSYKSPTEEELCRSEDSLLYIVKPRQFVDHGEEFGFNPEEMAQQFLLASDGEYLNLNETQLADSEGVRKRVITLLKDAASEKGMNLYKMVEDFNKEKGVQSR